ncbi:MAG: hypothetical protein KDD94_04125 [Calditrichaeota bacterium]|nr:hypothetical protein [Calditrichota bacterium]
MKLTNITVLFALLSCSSTSEPASPADPGQVSNVIQPLKIGYVWNYTQIDSNSDVTNEKREVISRSNDWYEMEINDADTYYLSNLTDGLHFLISSTESQLLIKYPANKSDQFSSGNAQYRVQNVDTMITTAAGTFSCYRYSRYTNTDILQTDNFYAVDIGYIKRIDYDTVTHAIHKTLELTSYTFK